MAFQSVAFQSGLNKYVEAVFHFNDPVNSYSIDRFVPTGHVFLVFELNDEPQYVYDNMTLQPQQHVRNVFICGMQRNYLSISRHNGSDNVAVQFRATGAYPFLHHPICNLSDKIVPAKDLLGEDILRLRHKLQQDSRMEIRFAHIEDWLLERFDINKTPPAELIALEQIMRNSPFSGLKEIIKEYPKTQKKSHTSVQ